MATIRLPTLRSLRYHQVMTVVLLFGGYASLYFCRADLSVAMPLLIDELGVHGVSHGTAVIRMGQIASFGVLAYALGKLFLCGLGDLWGGRISFLIGLGGATLFTLLFTTSSYIPVFTIAWFGNRLTQSVAWAGLLKISSKWFDFSTYGAIVGILSVSYLVGDAVARQWMGVMISDGFGWRPLFYLAAAAASLMLIANLWLLRESRIDAGFTEGQPSELILLLRVAAGQLPATAGAAAAQPRLSADMPAVAGLHHHSRDLQRLDSGVSA